MSASEDDNQRKLTRRGFLKWTTALVAAGAAVIGLGAGYGTDLLLRPTTEKTTTQTTTKTGTTTVTQPAQTSTVTTTQTVTAPVTTLSYVPPLSPEVRARVQTITTQLVSKHAGETIVYGGGCGINCGGGGGWDSGCLFKVHLKNGVITAIEADDTVNLGVGREDEVPGVIGTVNIQRRPCARGRAWRKDIYSPDRILYPMKSVGARGVGSFTRISWDEALGTVATNMQKMKATYGPYSIGTVYYTNSTILQYFGCGVQGWSTASFEATNFAGLQMMGAYPWIPYINHEAPDIFNSKLIVIWGWDPTTTEFMIFSKYYLTLAKEKGIPIIAIDPRYTASAEVFADQWVPIRPGTDVTMMLAMANVIFKENLYDTNYVAKFVEPTGLAKWKDYVLGVAAGPDGAIDRTPEWAEKICGVPADTIRAFARLYAGTKPCHLNVSWCQARQPYGENVARAAIALHALTGNIGVSGGASAIGDGFTARGVYNQPAVDYKQGTAPALPTLYCNWKWADAVLLKEKVDNGMMSEADYDSIIGNPAGNPMPNLHMLWVDHNIFNQHVDTNKQIQAIMKMDFIVAIGQHMTPSNKYADIILPQSDFFFENRMFTGPMYSPKIITTSGEAESNLQIQTQLAKKLGLLSSFMPLYTTDADWDSLMESLNKAAYEKWASTNSITVSWADYKAKPIIRFDVTGTPAYPLAAQISGGQKFGTKSGMIEVYSNYLATTDLKKTQYGGYVDPMPVWRPPWEGFYDPKVKTYPLTVVTPHGRYRIHSVQSENPWLAGDAYRHSVWISPSDAKARGINDGDLVKVYNDIGEEVVPAYVTSRITPGTACIYEGAWYNPNSQGTDLRGCSDIVCHSSSPTQMYPGAGGWPFTTLVEVEKL